VQKDNERVVGVKESNGEGRMAKAGLCVARTLVDCDRNAVPVRLMNPCNDAVLVYKDTTIGVISPICSVQATDDYSREHVYSVSRAETRCKTEPDRIASLPESLKSL